MCKLVVSDLDNHAESLFVHKLCDKELVELTRKTYKCETLHLAQAHRVLSKAIMAQQDFHNSNSFYHHAMEAIRIARSLLSPGHPMLHPFLSNFG